jgi:xanthine dehydrogenase accessory factor
MTTDVVPVLDAVLDAEAAGVGAALVTLVHAAGSTPRHEGARLLVKADGTTFGTIGGGKIEHEVTEAARAVARAAAPGGVFERHLTRELAMCCGGAMTLWLEPVSRGVAVAVAEALRRHAARRPCVLVSVRPGAGAAAGAPPGPGGMDVLERQECLELRRPVLAGDHFFAPLLPAPRLVLFGGGHVARAVAELAQGLGFAVVVCDEEPTMASPERFPGAKDLVHSFDRAEVERAIGPLGREDHAVILTRDHAVDQAILERLIGDERIGSVGMIGSAAKVARFKKRLEHKGIAAAAAWERVAAPVGLDIGAETPAEIAVAILAQLIDRSRARPKAPA